jgi:lipopolysaccharide transport system permease protein
MNTSSQSLVTGQNMLGKVYFPRVIFPITPVFARLVDFSISLLLVFGVMAYYQIAPSWNLLYLPIFIAMMVTIPAGVGMWLSSLAIRFRDVKFAMPFIIRMLIYSAPILYTATLIPDEYRIWYSLNPIVGVIEGFRACFLGTPIPWEYVWPGVLTTIVLVVSGALYFRRMEKIVVDVI